MFNQKSMWCKVLEIEYKRQREPQKW